MGFIRLIAIICTFYGAYQWKGKAYLHPSQAVAAIAQPATVSPVSPVAVKHPRRDANGTLLLTQTEVDYLSAQVDERYRTQQYTNVRLSDGTIIPLIFEQTGQICPRTGLPFMNIRVDAPIAVVP